MINIGNVSYVRAWSFALKNDNKNGVYVVLVNYGLYKDEIIDINVIDSNGIYKYYEYHIIGIGYDGLQTQTISVNGKLLRFENQKFPLLEALNGTGSVIVKPKSIVFVTGIQL